MFFIVLSIQSETFVSVLDNIEEVEKHTIALQQSNKVKCIQKKKKSVEVSRLIDLIIEMLLNGDYHKNSCKLLTLFLDTLFFKKLLVG